MRHAGGLGTGGVSGTHYFSLPAICPDLAYDALDGVQDGQAQNEFVKSTPSSATLSKCGVFMAFVPEIDVCSHD